MRQLLILGTLGALAAIVAAQPALAELPPFELKVARDGSLSATMGDDLRAWCDGPRRQFVLEYNAPHNIPVSAQDELGFVDRPFAEAGESALFIAMDVVLERPGRLVGRVRADKKLLRMLSDEQMAIVAPNEMGEPFYTGRSEALLRIAKDCAR